jgi:hypothetical protein
VPLGSAEIAPTPFEQSLALVAPQSDNGVKLLGAAFLGAERLGTVLEFFWRLQILLLTGGTHHLDWSITFHIVFLIISHTKPLPSFDSVDNVDSVDYVDYDRGNSGGLACYSIG